MPRRLKQLPRRPVPKKERPFRINPERPVQITITWWKLGVAALALGGVWFALSDRIDGVSARIDGINKTIAELDGAVRVVVDLLREGGSDGTGD